MTENPCPSIKDQVTLVTASLTSNVKNRSYVICISQSILATNNPKYSLRYQNYGVHNVPGRLLLWFNVISKETCNLSAGRATSNTCIVFILLMPVVVVVVKFV